MYLFTISYGSYAMVDSVDDLKSSSSTRGIQMPNFEVLDARIASALNKIIHNTQFTRRISLEEHKAQKQDRFLRGRQIAYLIGSQEPTILSKTTPTYLLLFFELMIFRPPIYLLHQLISMDLDFRNFSSPGLLKSRTIRATASWQ